ncbi:MAG: sigma-70 family RNA polymerase sigma factor [Planctomycetes bacterium]|nr:sigma-70 family RNA polymerase sigma factor [Planctomycetota bacterium]
MNMADARDDELLGLIARKNEDPDSAADAWVELHSRHVPFVYSCVKDAGSLVGRGVGIEDIVEQTFQRVYLTAAETFRPGEYADSDAARHHVLAWIGTIARKEFLKAIESRGNEYLAVYEPDPEASSEFEREGSQPVAEQQSQLRQVAETVLSPDELEIVWLKMQYYDADAGESRLPSDELEGICTRQGITKAAFRKRYARALDKIEQAFTKAT